MNRNVSIVIAILVLVVIAGYLVWVRSKVSSPVSPQSEQVQVIPSVEPTLVATSSAVPEVKEATATAKPKTATPGASKR